MTLYTDLTIDQLRSAILQRDEQLRVALAEVEEWKQSTTAVALASQEVEKELKGELEAATAAYAEMRYALQELHDWQNGPPLVTYEKGWTKAMKLTEQALSTTIGT